MVERVFVIKYKISFANFIRFNKLAETTDFGHQFCYAF